ncbi:MAG: gliding motility-associated C-terminal domain-containing protein [Flavobacteriales bacterium]|nr:gliding motility-associated C-terminal domain-containing protein [Flavobacteriales bacterium]
MKQLLLLILLVIAPGLIVAQTGTEFWVAPPDVTFLHNQPGDEPIYFNVTAGNTAATVTIAQPANAGFNGGTPIVLNVPANSSVRYNMTSLKAQLETRPTNTICNTGLHITATEDITCYYECSNTNNPDILALKGANGLGTEFYIPLHKHAPFYNNDFGNNANKAFASFEIVATEDNTTVLINSPVDVDGHPAQTPFMIILNQGQTYSCANTLYSTYTDPTKHPSGAAVLSDKPIAVSIKDDSNHNPSGGCYDLMMDQIVPVGILGTDYVAVKGALYATGDESVFLMAVENNTKIYIDGSGTPVATLFAGQYYRHDMDYLSAGPDNATYMSASKPVYAIHVTGFGCEMGMAILPPLNCAGSQQVGVTRSTNEGFFLNLLVRTGSQNDFVVTGPGTATIPGSAFVTVPGTGGEWMAARIQYNTTQVPVNQAIVVSNTSDVFSLGVINGGAGSGCRYGFFSEFSGRIDVSAGADQDLCAGESAELTGTVSGGSTTGKWTTTGSGTFQPSNTSLSATYEPSIGDIALGNVTLTLTSTGPCTPQQDDLTLTFHPKPIPNAGPDQQVCKNAPVVSLSGSVLNAVGGVWTGGAGSFLPSNSNMNPTYTPTAAEIAADSVWIYLTTTGNGVCDAVKDSMLVHFTPTPTVNAGADKVLCANNAATTLNGSFTVATGGVWSGGLGTFDPSTTNMNAIYTPTAAEIASGSVTLTLTSTGNGSCIVVTDQVLLSFTTAPAANAGANSSVCSNNANIALNGSVTVATGGAWSGGTGSFSPNNASLNAVYTPTAAEINNGSVTLILTTTGNGNCTPATSSRTITFTPAPIVDAGANGTVCANAPAITLNGSVTGATGGTWSGGTGTYSPNASTLNITYTPSAAEITAGTVTLLLTSTGNGTCNAVSDQVTYLITPAPTANAGADQTLCANNPVASLNGSFTLATGGVWSGGNGSFDPSTTNMVATYTPTAAEIANGSVTLTLTTTGNNNCLATTDQVVLAFTAAPSVNAGANSSACVNNSTIALNGSVAGASGGVWSGGNGSFTPNNTSLSGSYTPTASEIAANTVTLTLTTTGNGNCLAVSNSRTITFTPAPVVDAGPNASVCANAPAMQLAGSVTGATGAIWSGGSGTYNPNNTTLNAVYTPTAAERTAGTVTLTLSSVGNGTCNAVSDQVTWTITAAPTVNAGLDRVVCGNNAAVTLNGSFNIATGAVWSGAGSFDPSTTNTNATYTPSAAEVSTGSATLTLTTTGNGLCSAVSDQVLLTYTTAPTANAGANSTLCANNAAVVLNGSITVATGGTWSGGTGVFTPNNTTLNASYAPTAAEIAAGQVTLILTTTGNGTCNPASNSRTITFSPAPIVNAGPSASVCANASAMQLAGSVTGATGGIWSGGTGTYNPNNTTLNAVYTPSAAERTAGTVNLTLTSAGNGLCNAVSDQVTWTITPAPTVNAGPDQSLCSNNPMATLAGSYTVATGAAWSGGNGTFSPSASNVNATYTPTAAEVSSGSVTLTLTTTGNNNCVAVSDQVVLNFTPAPTANAGADVTRCANNANVVLNGSVTISTGGVWSGGAGSFTPNNTALNATYTPTATEISAGILTLTLTTTGNSNCSAVTDSKQITFTPAPTVNAGPNGTVCANASAITLAGVVNGATGATWSGGAGTYNPNNTTLNAVYTPSAAERTAGTVTLTLTTTGNGLCNAVNDQVTYLITPAPTVNAGPDQSLCANNAVANLNGSFTVATGATWGGGLGTFSPSATNMNATYGPTAAEIANGSVTLTLTTTGNNNCVAVSDAMVLSFTAAPTANAGADVTRCANNASVTLNGSVTIATGGVWSGGAGSYTPNNMTLSATYIPTATEISGGILTLTLTTTGNNNCSAVTDSKQITFTPAPAVDAGPNGTVCANASAITMAGVVTGATGATWSGGAGTYNPNNTTLNAVYTPSAAERTAGTVTLTLTTTGNGLCNAVNDQVTYLITPAPTVNAGPDQSLCANNAVATLNGSFSVATGAVWSGGLGTFSPSASYVGATYTPTAGEISNGSVTLTLTTTGNNNCMAVSDAVMLSFTPAPTVNAGADVTVCVNNANVSLNGSVSIATGGVWSGGAGSFTPNNTTLNATYAPTPGELAGGTLTLTLTSTGNGNCGVASDSKLITFSQAPIVNAGPNASVCANASAMQLVGSVSGATGAIWSGGNGTYSPNSSTLNATYTPTAAERTAGTVTLTLTSAGNGLCNAVGDQVTWTITPAPTVNAGPDQSLCSNNPAATLAGSYTVATGAVWSGGNGTFSPSASNVNATYTPTSTEISSGAVTLTLTTTGNNNCVAVFDQVVLNFTPAPTANAGADVTRCANNANVVLNGSVTIATGGVWSGGAGSFTPNNTALNATYTPTATEISAGILTLTLTTTGNSNCSAVTDSKQITFTPAPTVNAGPNGTVCANASAISLAGVVTGATGATWSGGTGTYNPNNTTLNAVYTPSAAERTAGTVTLTLTTTGNGLCNAVIDHVTYLITPAPTVNAGPDQSLCANNSVANLNGSFTVATGATWGGGLGTFSPSATNMNATYAPTAAEIANGSVTLTLSTTGNNNCVAVSDAMVLSFTAAPTANAGADVTRCANNASVTLNGSVTIATGGVWSGGAGSYTPNNTTLSATYTPTATEISGGILTLTLTTTGNNNCSAVTDTKEITFSPAPTVDAGANGTVCANASAISLAGAVIGATGATWSGGTGAYNPNNTTLTAVYTPSAAERTAGTVTLTLTSTGNGLCNAVIDQVTYLITPAPTVNAGADQSLCSNNAVATLGGSFTVATGATWGGGLGTFSPSASNMNATYTPTAAEIANGSVALTLTTTGNNNCVAVSDALVLSFTPMPTANAGTDITRCANNATVALNGSVTVATSGAWSGGAGSFNPNNTALNATYTPTVTEIANGILNLVLTTTGNNNCTAVKDTVRVNFTPAPTVDAGPNGTVCSNASAITLAGVVTGATGATWSGGTGTYNPNSTTLNAVYTPSAAERTAGTVTLTLTTTGNGLCNAVNDHVTYLITPAPTVNAGADQSLCANNAAATLNGSFSVATGAVWSGGLGTFSPSASYVNATYTPTATEISNGSVTLTLTTTGNNNCVPVSDAVMLNFTPAPTVNAGVDVTVCVNNASVALSGSVSIATGGVWSGGAGSFTPNNTTLNATYTPTPAELAGGTLTLTLTSTGNGNCGGVSDSKLITFSSAPIVDAGLNTSVCANAPAMQLVGTVGGASGAIWSGGNGTYSPNNSTLNAIYTPTLAERTAGTVTLTLTSAGNGLCNAVSDQVTWTITPAPTVSAGPDQSLCANNATATLAGGFTVATGAAWSGGLGTFSPSAANMNATYTPTADEISNGSVTLTLTTTGNNNCVAVSDAITLAFTPAPTVNAGTDATVCVNNANVSLNGTVTIATGGIWSGGLGSFTPSNTTLNAVYTPTPSELAAGSLTLTLTSSGNGNCGLVSDSKLINFTPAPMVDAGLNGTVCANNSAIILAGVVNGASGAIWSGGTGTYSPNSSTLNATYTPSAAERTAGSVTLTLTTVGNGNCTAVSDQVSYSITPGPTANAGSDRVLCANNPVTSLSGAFTVATGGIWSGGNGTFDPSTTNMSAIYTPTATEITNGSLTLTLTTTGNGLCNAAIDQVVLNFTDAPSANAGPDVTRCANNGAVALNGSVVTATGGTWSGGTGTYTPNANTLNATYNPGPGDIAAGMVTLTLTTTGNGNCTPASDTRIITYTPAPILNAGADATVCANSPAVTLNGSVNGAVGGVWSGGNGTYSPNSITLNATYTPSAAEISSGGFTLTLTSAGNGTCNAVTDQVHFTITPAPTVNAGVDQTLCGNNGTATLNAAITVANGVQWSGGSGLYSPGSTAQNITYTPSAIEVSNGLVTLTATTTGNGNCAAVADQVQITFTTAPMANAGVDQSVSANNAATTLAGSYSIATGMVWSGGAGTYNPNNTTTNAVYTPTPAEIASGSVTLTLTTTGNGSCAAAIDAMTITFSDAPTTNAGPDQVICGNNAVVALNGSVTIATGGIWSGGTGSYTPNNTSLNTTYYPSAAEIAAGSVTLTLTSVGNGNSNPVTDQIVITISPAPVVNAGNNFTVCANNPTAQLGGVVNHAGGGVWSGGSGTFNPGNNNLNATYTPTLGEIAAGTVTLTLTSTNNGTCNVVSDQVVITIAPAPVVDAGIDRTVCSNNASVQLAGSISNATGGIWSGGTGGFSPSINALNAVYTPSALELANGSITLTLTSTGNGTCTAVSDAMTIYISQGPTVNAGVDRTVCANDPSVILDGTVTIAGGAVWSGGGGTWSPDANTLNATYHPSPAEVALGTATLTLTTIQNGLCNGVNDQMTITIIASPAANAGNDLFACSNNAQVQLGGSVSGAGGGQWSGGAGSFTPSIASLNAVYTPTAAEIAGGTMTLTLITIGNGNCVPVSDQVLITFTASPTANAGADGVRCANNAAIQLGGSVTVANGGTWSGGGGTFSPNANALNAVYTPSLGEIAAGSATLTLTTTGNNGCTAVTDEVTYTFTPAPTANAGSDASICANNATLQLNGSVTVATGGLWSGGAGSFSPNSGILNAVYTPTAAEVSAGTVTLTLTTVGNALCNAVSDQMVVTITPAPVVDAGQPLQSCANNPSVQLAGSVQNATGGTWTGAGSFSPDANSLSAIYTPSAAEVIAGTATVTLTSTGNGLCNAVSDQVTITITDAPVVEAGAAQTLCANNIAAQLNGQVTNATGGNWTGGAGSFSPNAATVNAVYTASAAEVNAGGLWLYLTSTGNGGCLSSRDSVRLDYTPAPTVNAGLDAHVCANASEVQLAGAVTVANGGTWSGGAGAFTPNAQMLNASYAPTALEIAAGQMSLVLTSTGNGNCTAVRDSLVIIVDPVPVVNAGPDQQICANNPNFQLNGFVGNAPGGQWTGGMGNYFPNNTSLALQYTPTEAEVTAGSITFTLTSTGTSICVAVTDQMTVYFTGAPVVNAGTDLAVCANNSAVQLNGNVNNANGGAWSGGSGAFSPSNNVFSPIYTPTASEIASGSLNLYLTSTGNGNCFAVRDTIAITFTPAPTVNAGVDLDVCANNPLVTLNGAITVAGGAQWSGGLGTYSPNAQTLNAQYVPSNFELQTGSVELTLTTTGNGNCLAVVDQVTLTVTPAPVVSAGADITTCSSDLQVPMTGSVQGGSTTGTWSTSGTGSFFPSATALNATYMASALDSLNGTVDLTLTSTNNGLCNVVSDMMTLTILPNAIANAGVDQSICASQATVQLAGSISGNATEGHWTTNGAGSFTPNANAASAVYQVAPGDQGTLTFTWSVNSCDNAMDQMNVTIVPVSSANAGADQVVCFGNLNVLINGQVSGASSSGVWSTLGSGSFANPADALANIYHASAQDSLAHGVSLVLTATNTGACTADVDTVYIAIQPSGTVNAGQDLSFCANNATVQLAGTISGDATQVQWTTSGSGSFYPSNSVLTPTYIPSNIDTAIGSLTLTLNAVNSCNNASDAMTLELTPAPYVNAGPDQTFCDQVSQFNLSGMISGITTVGQWTTTGTGTIANAGALNTTYTASAADIAAGQIHFTLTSLNNGNCGPVSDAMTIYLTAGIIVSAGPDQSVCVLSDHANLQGSIQNGSPSGIWTATGTGTFQPSADVLNAQYFFSAADVANGSVVLTFTATNTGTCPSGSDQMTLTFGSTSYAFAGADQNLCANSPIAQLAGNFSGGAQGILWSTSGSGSFSNNTDPNATYTLSNADIAAGAVQLTITTITNGSCAASSDAVTLNVRALPNITAGSDIIACTAAPVQLAANAANAPGGTWTTSGTGTFFDANALATLYYPSAADSTIGTVTLTVATTGTLPCSAVSDALIITFGGGLAAQAGQDVITCSTDPNIPLNGAVAGTTTGQWSTTGTGSFSPSATALNATYIPGAADYVIGNISLVLSTTNNAGCPAGKDTLVVSYHVPPTVNAGADLLLCDGLSPIQLNGTAQNDSLVQWVTDGTGSFSPNANTLNATYIPTATDSIAGGVNLVLTAYGTGTCGNASDALFIGVGPTRIANAGTDLNVCADGSPVQLAGNITGVSGGTWSTNGTGTFVPDANALNTSYVPSAPDLVFQQLSFVLTTTGNMGCPAHNDTVAVYIHQPPTVSAGADLMLCDGIVPVQLNGTAQNDSLVQWITAGTGSFSPDANALNAIYMPSASDSIAGGVHLSLTAYGTGNCGSVVDTLFIGIGPTRIANAGTDLDMCANGDPIPLAGNITGVSGGAWTTNGTGTFLPDANELNATYVPSAPDLVFQQLSFVLTTTGNMGCPAHSDTLAVHMHQPSTVNAGTDITTCDVSADVQMAGTYTGATGIQWTTNGSGVFLPNNTTANAIYQPGATDSLLQHVNLFLTTTGDLFCAAAVDTVKLSFVNPLHAAFTFGNACAGSTTAFTDASTTTGSPIIGWSWDFGNGNSAAGQQAGNTFPGAGQYPVSLTVFAQNGCSATTSQVVEVMFAPTAGFSYTGDAFTGEPIAFTDSSFGGNGWHYDFGDGQGSLSQEPTHTYTDAGQFIIVQTVSNAAGCTASDSMLIAITENKIVPPKLPDAFSPNGDGMNDIFYVRGGPFETMELKIFNGWGEMVFETTDPEFGWDGTHNGKPEINGVYVYTVVATSVEGQDFDRSGKVTLIR